MAQYAMIDGYLDTMRTEIPWLRDLDDVVSEMEDHLYSTVEGMLATGLEPDTAQRETLERFGEPKILAGLYASSNSGGIAVPTKTTKQAGTLALVAAAFWLAAAALYWIDTVNDLGGDSETHISYLLWAGLVGVAGVLGLFVMVALGKRHGGFGAAGLIGLAIASLGVLLSILFTWGTPGWMSLLGVGYLITGIKMWSPGLAPKGSTVLFAAGMPIGVIALVVANVLEFGWVDRHGDHPAAFITGLVVGLTLTAIGLIGIGLWLRSEDPVDTSTDTTLTA